MAFVYHRFSLFNLPNRPFETPQPVTPAGTLLLGTCGIGGIPQSDLTALATPVTVRLPGGGLYDVYGNEQTDMEPGRVSKRLVLLGDDNILDAALNDYRSYLGKKGLLWRQGEASDVRGVEEAHMVARLSGVRVMRDHSAYLELLVEFQLLGAHWDGGVNGSWLLDGGDDLDSSKTLDDGPTVTFTNTTTLLLPNAGNASISDLTLSLTAGGAGAPSVTFKVTDSSSAIDFFSEFWYFNAAASIPAGATLLVDCFKKKMSLDGSPAWEHFNFGPNHEIDEWIRVNPGGSYLTVLATGADQVLGVASYNDGWI